MPEDDDDNFDTAKETFEAISWQVAGALAGDAAMPVIASLQMLYDMANTAKSPDEKMVSNPQFIMNGHSGRGSPKTQSYFGYRKDLAFLSAMLGWGSKLGSVATQVDVGGILKEGNALGSSVGHLCKVRAIGARYRQSETITRWVDAVQTAKGLKIAVRTVDLAGAAIPIGAVGLGTGVATAVAKAGIKVTIGGLMGRTAMELHWRAYQEIAISRVLVAPNGKPVGPASGILYELFTKRGMTRIFGQHDIANIIKEPAGWLAVRDKLMLM
ncbi:hypothetical protein HJ526_17905 [Donghicola sp. C2-DW-16]|uniref:Uncharacterized protein n=1 Tax=Donghicola mangrovi TaxID=2729614 RepID=A0A850Q1Z2_9RHOB|nr:hypothetical protein [Donghicola mangrovi]NVO23013.1 hypothetical protein [Donghicola mangrovi]NVO29299.1 hypothetical protein [Donghicola mangrovi]